VPAPGSCVCKAAKSARSTQPSSKSCQTESPPGVWPGPPDAGSQASAPPGRLVRPFWSTATEQADQTATAATAMDKAATGRCFSSMLLASAPPEIIRRSPKGLCREVPAGRSPPICGSFCQPPPHRDPKEQEPPAWQSRVDLPAKVKSNPSVGNRNAFGGVRTPGGSRGLQSR